MENSWIENPNYENNALVPLLYVDFLFFLKNTKILFFGGILMFRLWAILANFSSFGQIFLHW
jgi:hypothetical protein